MRLTINQIRRIIREEKEDLDELDELEEIDELDEDDHWGSKEDEYKRHHGHRSGDVGGHYKDYEGPYGGKKGEYKRSGGHKTGDVGGHYKDYEGPYGGSKGDKSATHPGRKDYMGETRNPRKRRLSRRQLRKMVREEKQRIERRASLRESIAAFGGPGFASHLHRVDPTARTLGTVAGNQRTTVPQRALAGSRQARRLIENAIAAGVDLQELHRSLGNFIKYGKM